MAFHPNFLDWLIIRLNFLTCLKIFDLVDYLQRTCSNLKDGIPNTIIMCQLDVSIMEVLGEFGKFFSIDIWSLPISSLLWMLILNWVSEALVLKWPRNLASYEGLVNWFYDVLHILSKQFWKKIILSAVY